MSLIPKRLILLALLVFVCSAPAATPDDTYRYTKYYYCLGTGSCSTDFQQTTSMIVNRDHTLRNNSRNSMHVNARAISDYGILKANITNQWAVPSETPETAYAAIGGGFVDMMRIDFAPFTGDQGFLKVRYKLSGQQSSQGFNANAFAEVDVTVDSDQFAGRIHSSPDTGTFDVPSFKFIYGKWFKFDFSLGVAAGTVWVDSPNQAWALRQTTSSGVATADYSNTLVLTNLIVTDKNGAEITGATFSSVSGIAYTRDGVSPIPEATRGPSFTAAGVVNAASFVAGSVAPGEMITVFGSGFGVEALAPSTISPDGRLVTILADTRLLFNGIAAPLIYAAKNQISAIAPFGIIPNTSVTAVLEYKGVQSSPVQLDVVPSSPAIFTSNASGNGQAAVLNQDGTLNTAGNPASKGTIVTFWMTGVGQTDPMGMDGRIAGPPFPTLKLPIVVGIDNIGAEILYAGAAPGLVEGIAQVNARIPTDAKTGNVPLAVKVGDTFSKTGVTISVR